MEQYLEILLLFILLFILLKSLYFLNHFKFQLIKLLIGNYLEGHLSLDLDGEFVEFVQAFLLLFIFLFIPGSAMTILSLFYKEHILFYVIPMSIG